MLGSFCIHFWVSLGSVWDLFGFGLGSFWVQFGIVLGRCLNNLGVILESVWDYVCLNCLNIGKVLLKKGSQRFPHNLASFGFPGSSEGLVHSFRTRRQSSKSHSMLGMPELAMSIGLRRVAQWISRYW